MQPNQKPSSSEEEATNNQLINGDSQKNNKGVMPNPVGTLIKKFQNQNEIRRDYEFMPATIEVLDRPPAPYSRAMLIFVIVFSAFVIGWASYAKMDIVVSAMGVVIPKDKVKVIQSVEPGKVTAIHIRDGQLVKKGDRLISMDSADAVTDIDSLKSERLKSELTLLRLKAQLAYDVTLFTPPEGTELNSINLQKDLLKQTITAQTEKIYSLNSEIERCFAEKESLQANVDRLNQSIPLSTELYEKKSTLAERKLISNVELIQAEIEMSDTKHDLINAKGRLQEVEARLDRAKEEKQLAETEYKRTILTKWEEERNKMETLSHQLAKAENKQTHCELVAPADGIVQQLTVNTIGAVVTAAQPLLIIVPTGGGLEIEAKVLNKDIGFITKDQDVSVKVTPYNFTRYGDLEGKIDWVASDAVIDQELGPIYPIRVSISDYKLPNVVNGKRGVITPGMVITADVKIGSRRVIHYFLGPILRYKDQSLREI